MSAQKPPVPRIPSGHLIWVLETELGSPARAISSLNCHSSLLFFFLSVFLSCFLFYLFETGSCVDFLLQTHCLARMPAPLSSASEDGIVCSLRIRLPAGPPHEKACLG